MNTRAPVGGFCGLPSDEAWVLALPPTVASELFGSGGETGRFRYSWAPVANKPDSSLMLTVGASDPAGTLVSADLGEVGGHVGECDREDQAVRAARLAIAPLPPSEPAPSSEAPPASKEPLETVQIQPDFYVIAGAGANVAFHVGSDGVVLVDTGSDARSADLVAEIRKVTPRPIRYIINTSADRDHVAGNDELSKAGQSIIPTGGLNEIGAAGGRAPILAEEHVQERMTAATGETAPFPIGAWPPSRDSSLKSLDLVFIEQFGGSRAA